MLKKDLIIYIGSFYILLGLVFLLIPLVYIEVGRPKDFVKASLNLIIGIFLIIKNKIFDNLNSVIYLLITLVVIFYILEIFSNRWNQLTDKEKIKLTTLGEFKKNISKLIEAFFVGINKLKNSLTFLKFEKKNEITNKKNWVRSEKK